MSSPTTSASQESILTSTSQEMSQSFQQNGQEITFDSDEDQRVRLYFYIFYKIIFISS